MYIIVYIYIYIYVYIYVYIYMAFNMALFRQSFLGAAPKKCFAMFGVFWGGSPHLASV